ncbi:hypothetical protein ANO11243_090070 [Dothideomycetidae sp. 11243]|nr:hypothetical protein ANO11243_090070 [fungal sp. No.11243]
MEAGFMYSKEQSEFVNSVLTRLKPKRKKGKNGLNHPRPVISRPLAVASQANPVAKRKETPANSRVKALSILGLSHREEGSDEQRALPEELLPRPSKRVFRFRGMTITVEWDAPEHRHGACANTSSAIDPRIGIHGEEEFKQLFDSLVASKSEGQGGSQSWMDWRSSVIDMVNHQGTDDLVPLLWQTDKDADVDELCECFFKTLVNHEVTVELKNDISIRGTLKSVDQYLNIKLDDITVMEDIKYPHLVREPTT